jgi:hypothetical protein
VLLVQRKPILRVAAPSDVKRRRPPFATLALLLGLLCAGIATAEAASPVAIVEEAYNAPPNLTELDYLSGDQRIEIPPGAFVVLSYFSSCVRERITGPAVVIVGSDQSVAPISQVQRARVPCDAGAMPLKSEESQDAAGFVDRSASRAASNLRVTPKPSATLYGSSPLISALKAIKIVLERVSGTPDRDTLTLEVRRNGAYYDYAQHGRALVAGAVYRLSAGSRSIVFRVSPDALPGATPLAGRILIF